MHAILPQIMVDNDAVSKTASTIIAFRRSEFNLCTRGIIFHPLSNMAWLLRAGRGLRLQSIVPNCHVVRRHLFRFMTATPPQIDIMQLLSQSNEKLQAEIKSERERAEEKRELQQAQWLATLKQERESQQAQWLAALNQQREKAEEKIEQQREKAEAKRTQLLTEAFKDAQLARDVLQATQSRLTLETTKHESLRVQFGLRILVGTFMSVG
jgi:hypothetical protein